MRWLGETGWVMVQAVRGTLAVLSCLPLGLLGGCYLSHTLEDHPDGGVVGRDAAEPDAGAPDSGFDADLCLPGEPCDCLGEGTVTWESVWYCATSAGALESGSTDPTECGSRGTRWGGRIIVQGRCPGSYRFCARVDSFAGCTIVDDVCTSGRLDPDTGLAVMPPPPGWAVGSSCARDALERSGGQTCVTISWSTESGDEGSRELGCFAAFAGGSGGGGGGGGYFGGEMGMWEF